MQRMMLMTAALLLGFSAHAEERIAVVGSTTVLPIVSEAAALYRQSHADLTITVSGGGSGVGVAAMRQGTAQIGMASRNTTHEEQAALDGKVDNIIVASDAVAVVVSKVVYESGVHQLSLQQIAAIYRGKIRNWKDVGGPDARILVIDKEASRGTCSLKPFWAAHMQGLMALRLFQARIMKSSRLYHAVITPLACSPMLG